MTRDEAKEVLLNGGMVGYHAWTWDQHYMSCGSYDEEYGACCEEHFSNIEEALDCIEQYCGGDWNDVEEA